jgi:hypothetical protein
MTTGYRLRCRYCDWSTLAWFTARNGHRHSGMNRLLDHVEDCHPERAEETRNRLVGLPEEPETGTRFIRPGEEER